MTTLRPENGPLIGVDGRPTSVGTAYLTQLERAGPLLEAQAALLEAQTAELSSTKTELSAFMSAITAALARYSAIDRAVYVTSDSGTVTDHDLVHNLNSTSIIPAIEYDGVASYLVYSAPVDENTWRLKFNAAVAQASVSGRFFRVVVLEV